MAVLFGSNHNLDSWRAVRAFTTSWQRSVASEIWLATPCAADAAAAPPAQQASGDFEVQLLQAENKAHDSEQTVAGPGGPRSHNDQEGQRVH